MQFACVNRSAVPTAKSRALCYSVIAKENEIKSLPQQGKVAAVRLTDEVFLFFK